MTCSSSTGATGSVASVPLLTLGYQQRRSVPLVAMVSYATGHTVSGWASLIIAVLFLGAVQLICLGLLGEYVGRVYTAVQGRPAYLVEEPAAETLLLTVGSGRP